MNKNKNHGFLLIFKKYFHNIRGTPSHLRCTSVPQRTIWGSLVHTNSRSDPKARLQQNCTTIYQFFTLHIIIIYQDYSLYGTICCYLPLKMSNGTVQLHFMRGMCSWRPSIIQDKFSHRNTCKVRGMLANASSKLLLACQLVSWES
jgi:hypothetical protein